jgi:predicted Rossmann-fold nucleotide-binding protein
LSECLTLVQTGKTRRIPIILVGGAFWQGLLDWMRAKLVGEGMVGARDLEMMQVIDDPDEIVEAIFRFYEGAGSSRRWKSVSGCSTCSLGSDDTASRSSADAAAPAFPGVPRC